MRNLEKICSACGAWQPCEDNGECRKNAPVIGGWPQTAGSDWCLQWIKDERPKAPVVKEEKRSQIGINYAFVRDYPEHAATWLNAALAAPDSIPLALRPVLADLFGAVWTPLLLDWGGNGDCCERLLCWAEQLPCFCNDDTAEEDADYRGLLMSMDDQDEITASRIALGEIPADHPWRTRQ